MRKYVGSTVVPSPGSLVIAKAAMTCDLGGGILIDCRQVSHFQRPEA